jgi:broad specificity phosphatase PhoE
MLILIRHGESVANAQGLLVGRTDAELTERGREQAMSARQLLFAPVSAIRTSPLRRARESAELLGFPLPAEVDDRWIEVDYGEYECQPLGDVPADVWREWRRSPDFRPPGGETLAEVDIRVTAACAELFAEEGVGARASRSDVVVVSHVTPIKAAVAWALGLGAELSWRLHLQTSAVTRIGWGNDVPVLHGFNEVAPGRDDRSQSRHA